jgi:hypothetical protein
MQYPGIWLQMFEDEKIPRIKGRATTANEDFRFMKAVTYSIRKIGCLGRFVGEVPMISAEDFNKLQNKMDPYEPDKKMCETFRVIVEPTHIHRDYDKSLLDALIKEGDFDPNDPRNSNLESQGLLIPYSLKNLKILAEHPLSQKSTKSVFNHFCPNVLDHFGSPLETVHIDFMRIKIPKQSRHLTYDGQRKMLESNGHEIMPLRTRLYFDVVEMLTEGT